jgi:hypothetical protein
VVVAREDTPGDKRLVAYFVTAPPTPTTADLRRFLSGKLPSYMVPSACVALEALPQTPNGKIDRRALPSPQAHGSPRDTSRVAPRNATEQTLADIVAAVLKTKDFGVHDSVFEMGADSIQVFQIVARANEAGLGLTPTQVLAGRTIAAICEQVEKTGLGQQDGPQLVAVSRDRYRVQRSRVNAPEGVHAER